MDGPWTAYQQPATEPKPWELYANPKSGAPAATEVSPAPETPPKAPRPLRSVRGTPGNDQPTGMIGNPVTAAVGATKDAWSKLKSDFIAAAPDPAKIPKGFWDQAKARFDSIVATGKLPLDAFYLVTAPLSGAIEATVQKPISKLTGIPEEKVGTALLAMGPEGRMKGPTVVAKAAAERGGPGPLDAFKEKATRIVKELHKAPIPQPSPPQQPGETPKPSPVDERPDAPGPILEPPKTGESVKQTGVRVDDALYRTVKHATADKIDANEFLASVPKAEMTPEFQAKVYGEIEQRMIDPKAKMTPDVEAFTSKTLKPWKDEEAQLFKEIKAMGAEGLEDQPLSNEGYVHRIVKGRGHYLDAADPESYRTADVVTGTGRIPTRSLGRTTSSLNQRKFFVLQDAEGGRTFMRKPPEGWEPGQRVRGSDGKLYQVKPATSAEVESNTQVRYHKNALINTVDNVLRLRRVKRNLELLDQLKPQLQRAGLAKTIAGNEEIPRHWIEPTLPQFRGWKVDPKIAHILNDFHGELLQGSALDQALAKVNRFIVSSLFAMPGGVAAHGANVMNHWIVGRGWDWLRPSGWYSLMKDGTRAVKAVTTQDQLYRQMLREGSALLYGDVANQNFYKLMIEKMGNEQVADPQTWKGIAKNLGFSTIADMVRWEYRAMSKSLWAISDTFMMQRVLELQRKGLPIREAIREAERDIPNYRVPSEVMGSRAVAEAIKSPRYLLFGRYKYGQFRAISEMIKDIVKPMKPGDRKEAAGKLLVLFGLGVVAYPLARDALRSVTGNKNADIYRRGPMAPVQGVYDLATGQRDWMSFLSSVITPAPTITGGLEILRNQDAFGRPIISPGSSALGKAVQGGEFAAGQTGPGEFAEETAKPGGTVSALARQGGVKYPTAKAAAGRAKGKIIERKQARRREARDPIEQQIKEFLGQ